METKSIITEADYLSSLREVSALIDLDPLEDSPEGQRLDVLGTLVQAYEAKHYLIDPPMEATVRLNVNITDELNRRLDQMSEKSGNSKSDLLRKAIILMELAVNENAKGNVLAVTDKNHHVLREIVGV